MRLRSLAAASAAALLLLGALRMPLLAWLACAPLVWASLRGTSVAGALALGAAFALEVALGAHAAWLAAAARSFFALSPLAALAAAVALCAAVAAPLGALLGLALRCASTLPRAWPVAASAAVWVAWEALTRMAFPYYPWIGLAATQAGVAPVVQIASLGGQAGLALVVALFGSALGAALHGASRPNAGAGDGAGALWGPLAGAGALVLATVAYGALRLGAAGEIGSTPLCTLAAVDARITGPDTPAAQVLERYRALGERAVASHPDAVVWPESALPRDPLLDPVLLQRLRDATRTGSTVLLAGGPRSAWDAAWRPLLYNSVFRIAGDEPVQSYDKREPVPFAEAWPALLPRPGWLETLDVAAGASAAPVPVGACRVGVLVCFEVERPGLAAGYAAAGADALVVASNDGQLPPRAIVTEVAEARLRAVETGLPVLRAANLGASVAIDRYGRAREGDGGIVSLAVPAAAPAPAVRWAGRVLGLCWLTVAATLVASATRGRRR